MGDVEIRLATLEDLPDLPVIEETAYGLFDQIPATAALPLILTPIEDFEAAQRDGRLWVAPSSSRVRAQRGKSSGFNR